MELHGMYMLALQDNDRKRAHRLVDKQKELARCFEMGKYYEISSGLELATLEKDTESVVTIYYNGRNAFMRGTNWRFQKITIL